MAFVELKGLTKRFGDVVACDQVDLTLQRGEVRALLGENGAGKTTLMSMLAGVLRPDGGEILVGGERVSPRSPKEAASLGIGMVHQQYRLVETFTVAENLFVGWQEVPPVFRRETLVRRAKEIIDRSDFVLDPTARIWELSVGQQQRLAILRALVRGAEVLIFDEPTAVLTPSESRQLFALIRRLVEKENKAVVFVSHKLEEVLEVSDQVTVLRAGSVVETRPTSGSTPSSLAKLMVGGQFELSLEKEPVPPGGEVLRAEALTVLDSRGIAALQGVDLSIRGGEIVGIAGVDGNGQSELCEVLTGLRRPDGGTVAANGTELSLGNVGEFIRAGIRYIPEDRATMGLLLAETIEQNSILRSFWKAPIAKGPFLDRSEIRKYATELAKRVWVGSNKSLTTSVGSLSGGNQQRLLAGREIFADPTVIVAVHPTRGVDVAARQELQRSLLQARTDGIGVLLISADLDEVLALSDRILVMYGGRVVGEFSATDFDVERIGLLMGGAGSARRPDRAASTVQ